MRLAWVLWSVLTSFYALLCFIPFTWTNFIRDHRYPQWLAGFLHVHLWLYLALMGMGVWTLRGRSRWIFLTAASVGAVWLFGNEIRTWTSTPMSWAISILIWSPYVLWEVLPKQQPSPGPQDDWRVRAAVDHLGLACFLSGVFVWAVYSGTFMLSGSSGSFDHLGLALALGSSLVAQILACLLIGLLVETWSVLGKRVWLASSIVAVSLACLIYSLIFTALDFRDWRAALSAAVLSGVLTLAIVQGKVIEKCERAVAVKWQGALLLLFAAIVPWAVPRLIGGQDWNRLFETLSYLIVAGTVFFVFSVWLRGRWPAMIPAAVLLIGVGLWPETPPMAALKHWSESEISFRTARYFLRRSDNEGSFYRFLQTQTNLSRSLNIPPRAVPLASSPAGPRTTRPHIFLFVVDSLRPDYLGAYNPKVRFTPNVDALAKDCLVFRNAWTVYGATGLSEPSIWAGSHLLHKQYVMPFDVVNRLEQLVTTEGYRRFVTRDVILTELLKTGTVTDPLDAQTTGHYKFSATLLELSKKIQALPPDHPPIFVYTQPQDNHISALEREKALVSEDPRWKGFHAPYAARIAEWDAALGRFISFLKEKKLYDESIIILTSDHGDSLGEGGRWGHAYTIYPEILRVPLLMRLPERFKKDRYSDVHAPAYLIDITPTLYSLLGWQMNNPHPLAGRSLTAMSKEEWETHRPNDRVAVSSYGPVYGVIAQGGRKLSIVDAVQYSAYAFDFSSGDPGESRSLSDADRVRVQGRIQNHIEQLNSAYR